MLLQNLVELVEKLRRRIDLHGDALRQSEALTRYALIDPLLRELGWDTSEPSLVVPEFRVANNQVADYVLFSDGRPLVVVESKKLDEPLRGGRALDQGILNCAHTGSRYFLLTDGKSWEVYESGRTTPMFALDLTESSASYVSLQLLALWRPEVQSGRVSPGQSPIVGLPDDSSSGDRRRPSIETEVRSDGASSETDWQLLSALRPQPHSKPAEVQFPDGRRVSISAWNALAIEVTRWLATNNELRPDHCPIQKASRYVVALSPTHPDGQPFRSARQVEPFFIETHHSARDLATITRQIVSHVGLDPDQFKVRFS